MQNTSPTESLSVNPQNPERQVHNILFETDHLKTGLRERSAKGGSITLVAQGLKFILQMTSNVFLARLLTPEDFGLVAMVAVVTGFVVMFKDMGLSMATVQKEQINHGQISTLFWINVTFSLFMAGVLVLCSPLVSKFYGEPRLTMITITLAGGLIFGGLSVQHQALLRRQMKFISLAAVEVTGMFVGVALAILSAWLGAGYWALVILQLGMAVSMAAGYWIACRWLPGLPVKRSGVRAMLNFGANMTGFSFSNYFARNADKMLLGWRWGAESVGYYSRAYALLLFPIGQFTVPFTSVAVPAMSRLQNEPQRYRNYYLSAVMFIAYISMPFVAMLTGLSTEVVSIVLGNQWGTSAVLFKILAFSAFWQPVVSTVGWLFVSSGQTHRMFFWSVVTTPIRILSFLIALAWGNMGVAIAYSIVTWLFLFPTFAFATYRSPIRVADLCKTLYRPVCMGVLIGLAAGVVRYLLIEYFIIWRILGALGIAGIVFILLLALDRSIRGDMKQIRDTVKLIFNKKPIKSTIPTHG